jgi:hypothetical protein
MPFWTSHNPAEIPANHGYTATNDAIMITLKGTTVA